jgi:uncharacterized protein DUF3149
MAWKLLFSSDIGLLSLFTIGFIIAMAIFLIYFFTRKAEEERQQSKAP